MPSPSTYHTIYLAILALACAVSSCQPALARRRSVCVEVRDPGVGTYRICPLAPRRR